MSATITFKMREALATRLAKAAVTTGLAPDDLVRLAVAHLMATIEASGGLSLPDGPPRGLPQNAVPIFLPPKVARPLIAAANATHFEGGVNGLVEWLVAIASEDFSRGDYSLIVDDPPIWRGRFTAAVREEEVAS